VASAAAFSYYSNLFASSMAKAAAFSSCSLSTRFYSSYLFASLAAIAAAIFSYRSFFFCCFIRSFSSALMRSYSASSF
jgi:hypothetical protein